MPGATTTVLYPQGAKFNMSYYMSTHMPLVSSKWGQFGLKSWKVLQLGSDAPYCVQATLEWGDITEFQKAAQSAEAKEVLGDVKNFSDKDPVLFTGNVEGSS